MAKMMQVLLQDDLTGEMGENIETVSFGFAGTTYEIDLTEENAAKFREELAPYVTAGRRLTKTGKTVQRVSSGVDAKAVRAWAEANKIEVPPRGRLPKDVVERYQAAGN